MTESPDQVGGDRVTSLHQSTGAEWRRVTQDIPGLVNLLAVALVSVQPVVQAHVCRRVVLAR